MNARINARQLAARFIAAAAVLNTIIDFADDPIAFLNDVHSDAVTAPQLHWTQRPENKAKLRRMRRKSAKAKVKKTAKVRSAKNVLHWTQLPENHSKVLRMNRASAKKRAAAA